MIEDGDREMIRGRIQEGRRKVGHRSEESRRQVGGISLKWAFGWNAESGILEPGFKEFGIQTVFKQKNISRTSELQSYFRSAKLQKYSDI
jgi:hypothetical protein